MIITQNKNKTEPLNLIFQKLNNNFLEKHLPVWLYCSNDKTAKNKLSKEIAINFYKYINLNLKSFKTSVLIFDIDKPQHQLFPSYNFLNLEIELPQPNFIVKNKDNDKHHAYYLLKNPVCTNEKGRAEPKKFLELVRKKLKILLASDPNYKHLITKNPFSLEFDRIDYHSELWELSELLTYCEDINIKTAPKQAPKRKISVNSVLQKGNRNTSLFNRGRISAYKLARSRSKKYTSITAFSLELMPILKHINADFSEPLPQSELDSTCKSIATFCLYKYNSSKKTKNNQLSPRRAGETIKDRQSDGALLSACVKAQNTLTKAKTAYNALLEAGSKPTQKNVAEKAQIGLRTVTRIWKEIKAET